MRGVRGPGYRAMNDKPFDLYEPTRDQRAAIADARERVARLTPREREILALVVRGYSNKKSGKHLGISDRTVEAHRLHIGAKMEITGMANLIRTALLAGVM